MAGSFTTYLERKLLDHAFGATIWTPPSVLYFAAMTSQPNDAGGGTEATGLGYARAAVTNSSSYFAAASGSLPSVKTTVADIAWSIATGIWSALSPMTHWAVFDSSTGGNMLVYGDLSPNTNVIVAGNVLSLPSGVVRITLD